MANDDARNNGRMLQNNSLTQKLARLDNTILERRIAIHKKAIRESAKEAKELMKKVRKIASTLVTYDSEQCRRAVHVDEDLALFGVLCGKEVPVPVRNRTLHAIIKDAMREELCDSRSEGTSLSAAGASNNNSKHVETAATLCPQIAEIENLMAERNESEDGELLECM